jgi:hypothetical protein
MNKPNSSLSQFIEEYPLYSKFGIDQPIEAVDLNNLAFNFFCKKEKEIQPFRLEAVIHNGNGVEHPTAAINGYLSEGIVTDFTEMFSGVCQSCLSYKASIIISGGTQKEKPKYFVRKIGQYPAPEASVVILPKEISDFLDDQGKEFYMKGLKNLELKHGIGAIAYFKKMIESEIEKIIEAVSNRYSPDSNKIAESVAAYKKDQQKSRFIEDITPYLPQSLKEHGANILLVLHDAASINMHELTEKECIKKSKDIDTLFRYLVRKINAERNEPLSEKPPGKYFLRYR